jgi:tetratricopeptide (TPR) repeat protein
VSAPTEISPHLAGYPFSEPERVAAASMLARISARMFGGKPAYESIGRFQVRGTLGSGGMGIVHEAYDPALDRSVAIKVLFAAHLGDEEARARLMREARLLARLAHPNVVTVHEVGEHAGDVFVVMERVVGDSLGVLQVRHHPDLGRLLAWYLQAAAGLASAHTVGVVHRDFKPSNVLVGADGRVRVLDFGLARTLAWEPDLEDGDAASLEARRTRSTIMGTPAYMSPEQANGHVLDARTDQFSFCVALWEAVHGVRPWSPHQVLAMGRDLVHRPAPARGSVRAPRWLDGILARGLHPDPDRRFRSIDDLASAIRRGLDRRRRWRSAAVVGPVVALAVGVPLWRGDPASRCPDPSSELVGAWDATHKRDLSEAMAEVSFGDELAAYLATRLDAYADGWVQARQHTCQAAQIEGRQSAEQFDLSLACLDRRRHALAATVDVLTTDDPEVLSRADQVLRQLPVIEDCTQTDVLRSGPGPVPPERAAEVEALARRIDRARAESAAGRSEAALADDLIVSAERTAYPPPLAEALLVRGLAEAAGGRGREARDTLTRAGTLAVTWNLPRVGREAFRALVDVATRDLEDTRAAKEWLAMARAFAVRLGEPLDLLAEDRHLEALIVAAEGAYSRAIELHDEALALAGTALEEDDPRRAEIERQRGNTLLRSGDIDGAVAVYESLRRFHAARLGPRHPELGRLEHNLALADEGRGDIDGAIAHHRRALAIHEAAFGSDAPRVALSLTALAQLEHARGHSDDAEAMASRAWRLQREHLPPGHSERGGALLVLAGIHVDTRALDRALEEHRELKQEFSTGARRGELPRVHQNTGWLLCELGRCLEAQREFELALAEADPDGSLAIYSRLGMARVTLARGDFGGTIRASEALLAEAEALPREEHPQLVPEIQWALARALDQRGGPGDAERSRDLLEAALRGYGEAGPAGAANAAAMISGERR